MGGCQQCGKSKESDNIIVNLDPKIENPEKDESPTTVQMENQV